jgi:hypothetical protein
MRRIDVGTWHADRAELAAWCAGDIEVKSAIGLSVAEFAQLIGLRH